MNNRKNFGAHKNRIIGLKKSTIHQGLLLSRIHCLVTSVPSELKRVILDKLSVQREVDLSC